MHSSIQSIFLQILVPLRFFTTLRKLSQSKWPQIFNFDRGNKKLRRNGRFFDRTEWDQKIPIQAEATPKLRIVICEASEASIHKLAHTSIFFVTGGKRFCPRVHNTREIPYQVYGWRFVIPKSLAMKATHRGQRVISLEMKHFACCTMAGSHFQCSE